MRILVLLSCLLFVTAQQEQQRFQFECEYEGVGGSANHELALCSEGIKQALFDVMSDCVRDVLECRYGTEYTARDEQFHTFYSLEDDRRFDLGDRQLVVGEQEERKLQNPDPNCALCLMYGLDCTAVCGCFPDPCDDGDRRQRKLLRASAATALSGRGGGVLRDGTECDSFDDSDLSIAEEITQQCGGAVREFVKDLDGEESCLGHWSRTICAAVVRPVEA